MAVVPPTRPGQVARRRPNEEQEQQRNAPDTAGGGNSAPVVTPQNAHQLQQQIGNRAVGQLAGGGAGAEAAEPAEQAAAQTEQQQAEPEEERAGYTESEIAVMLGRTEAFGPNVPTFEVISATTSAQLSQGELEQEVGQLWTREQIGFTEAARQAAETDSATRQGSAIPTQSANFEPDQSYSQRWMLGFYAYDYEKGGSDLPEVKKLLRRGSGFQRSVESDFDQVFPFENPSGAQISSAINEKSRHLRRGMERQETGELVVFFSGHGSGRSIMGADGEPVVWSELTSLATLAQDLGIHTVYVLDTCRAGSLASLAQLAAQDDIDENIAESDIPDTATMASRSETLRTLSTESLAAKEAALDLLNWHRWHRRSTRKRMAPDVIAQAEEQRTLATNQLGEHIRNIHALLYRTEEEAVPHRADLIRQSSLLMLGSVWALEPRRIRGFLNDIAPFFDTMNDSINAQLIALRKTVETARQTDPDG